MPGLTGHRRSARVSHFVRSEPHGNVCFWRILLKNSLRAPMQKIICVVSAVSYAWCEGVAAYSGNPAGTTLRGVDVASNCESTFEKNSRNFASAAHLSFSTELGRLAAVLSRRPERPE